METNHLPNKSGFKTPQTYFDTFEDALDANLFLNQPKASGFKTPKNYFNDFNVEIETTKIEKEVSKVRPLFSKKTLITITSIAATFALLFTLTLKNKSVSIDAINNETISNYILDEASTTDFTLLLEDVSLDESDFLTLETDNLNTLYNELDLDDLIQD